MIEENERAAKFMQAIQRDGEKRRTAIIQAIDEEIAAGAGKSEDRRRGQRGRWGTMRKSACRKRPTASCLTVWWETGAELAARRSEIAHEVFDACEERLAAFTAKPNMPTIRKKSADALLALLHADKVGMGARPQDVEAAKSAVPAGCEVTADTTIRGRPARQMRRAGGGRHVDMKLEAQKDWFCRIPACPSPFNFETEVNRIGSKISYSTASTARWSPSKARLAFP